MSEFVNSLYEERAVLMLRLKKVNEAISLYTVDNETRYPLNGTWKDKIRYVLTLNNKGMRSKAIAEAIKSHEPDLDIAKVKKTVSQYLWFMHKDGSIFKTKAIGNALYFNKEG